MQWAAGSNLLIPLLEIIAINIVLSGDNAVVIALACRSLPPRQQRQAFLLGGVGIIVLMAILTAFASYLLSLRYLEIAGGVVLLWIAIKLLLPEDDSDPVKESRHLLEAVKTIIIADIIMSFDNVLGMAGAARGHLSMLFVGLVITIPLVLFCSAIISRLMQRFPILVVLGGALLGYVAGEMAIGDPSLSHWVAVHAPILPTVVPIVAAMFVVATGKPLAHRSESKAESLPALHHAGSGEHGGDGL